MPFRVACPRVTENPRPASAEPSADVVALRLARRELKWVRTEQEYQAETLQLVRRQRARLREQVDALATALAESLSSAYWAEQQSPSRWGLPRRQQAVRDPEAELVREVEDCDLFDAAWYLRQHPAAVRSGTAPALHYVRNGNAKGLDPGPGFSTSVYLARHPEAAESGLPALVHAVRTGALHDDATPDSADTSPASDVHL